jgi:uncharacterized phage-like protein YoqJ
MKDTIQKAIEEALEKLANEEFDWSADCGGQLPYDEWVVHTAQKALAALRAVNETHVMVPVEPSEEMENAFWDARKLDGHKIFADFRNAYRAMIAAQKEG